MTKTLLITCLLFSYLLQSALCVLVKDKVIAAIKCGSRKPYKSSYSEVEFSEDKYYRGGIESSAGEQYSDAWPDIPDIALYQTERYTNGEALPYEIPLKMPIDGHYVLVLKFSEVYFTSSGKKVFHVALGPKIVLNNVDIYDKVGKFAPYDEFVEFDVKNKVVYFNGQAIDSAITPKDALIVRFVRGGADNPKVNSIILVKGTLADTDYAEYMEKYRKPEKLQQLKAERQNEKLKREISGMLEQDEDLDLSTLGQKYEKGRYEIVKYEDSLKSTINTFLDIPYGLEAASIAFVAIFFFLFSMVFCE